MKTFISDLSGKEFPEEDKISGKSIRPAVLALIRRDHPHFDERQFLSAGEHNSYREKYISTFLPKQLDEMSELEKTVLHSLSDNSILAARIREEENIPMTFGQRLADRVATFGGSWTFILSFAVFLLFWIGVNVFWLTNKGFDPYPFILLNLILSSIAALQAPVIMMSQNRQEEKDRERARNDYMVNLKSEIEIRMLNEKLDHLVRHQEQQMLEIQKVQIDMLNDILKRFEKNNPL